MKRAFDILVAAVALIVLSPLLLATALLVRWKLGGAVLFRQVRPGLHCRPFTLIKFRTMRSACDADGQPLPDRERITRVGSFLRRTSLDEMPELWNVLKGDMSIVGPRPLLMEYLDFYTEEEMTRHEMRPGLTGLAQISGRNAITWEQKLALDIEYVKNWSWSLDMRIILATLGKVASGSGVLDEAPQGALHKYRGGKR